MGVPAATAHGDHDVEVRDGAFVPDRLEIRTGDTVEWKNEGERPHSVTADDGSFHSGTLERGRDFEVRFDEPGTHRYRSRVDGDAGLVGVVVVLPAEDRDSSGSGGSGSQDEGGPGSGEGDSSGSSGTRSSGTGSSKGGPSGSGSSGEGSVTDGSPGDASISAAAGATRSSSSLVSRAAVLAQAAAVTVQDDVFVPSRAEVDPGATVAWQHAGERPHTVTASDGSFDSGNLETRDSFTHTFAQPGTYSYYCRFHGTADGQGMAGVVVVRGGAAPGDAGGAAPGDAGGGAPGAGGLAATGASLVAPLGLAVALLAAGLWALRHSGHRRPFRRT
jgi:plastocyanin